VEGKITLSDFEAGALHPDSRWRVSDKLALKAQRLKLELDELNGAKPVEVVGIPDEKYTQTLGRSGQRCR